MIASPAATAAKVIRQHQGPALGGLVITPRAYGAHQPPADSIRATMIRVTTATMPNVQKMPIYRPFLASHVVEIFVCEAACPLRSKGVSNKRNTT